MPSPTKFLFIAVLFLTAFPSFAQVSNDDCTGAVALVVNPDTQCDYTIGGTTKGATASGLGLCDPQSNDVWYSFVATAPAHIIRVFNVREAYYNYYQESFSLEVFSGSCGQLQHLYCTTLDNGVSFGDLTPGETYYMRISHPYNTAINFNLCINTPNVPAPANDACANAVALAVSPGSTCDALVSGSTENASASPFAPAPNATPAGDVWYAFTATQATQVVILSEVVSITPNSFSSIGVAAYTGGCGNLVPMNRSTTIYNEGSLLLNTLTAGQTYYLRLFGYSNYPDYQVQFNICVTSPPPPPNDACAGAVLIVPESTFLDCSVQLNGTLYGATPSGTNCQAGSVNDVWYQFTAASPSQRVKVSLATNDNYGFEVYSGDCDHLTSIACVSGDDLARTFTNLTVGATYYLRVFSPTYSAFEFQVCVLNLPPPPANDECASALPLAINPGITYDLYTPGSTLGATTSLAACGSTETTHDVWYSFVATSVAHRILLYNNGDIFGTWQQLGYEVYQGDCDHLTNLACGNTPPNFNNETLLGALIPGDTYFIRVYSIFGSNHFFSLNLQTLPPPPANVDCALAQTLTSASMPDCGAPVFGNTTGVITIETANCMSGKALWFTFTATHNTHVLQITDVQNLFNTYSDYSLELHEGTDCSNLTYVRCYANPGTIYLNQLTVGKTYYLRWVSQAATAHSFQLCLSHFDPPANDACAGARPLTVHGNMTCYYPAQGNTAGSTAELPTGCLANADVWFRFTALQATQQIDISNVQSVENGNFVPLKAELLAGNCGNLNSLYCWPDVTYAPFTLFIGDLTPGQTYYLRIASPADILVRFDVCVRTPPKPPVNDNCANATVLTPETGDNCAPVIGTTEYATPTPGLPLPSGKAQGDVWYSFAASQPTQIVSMMYVNGYDNSRAVVEVYTSACGIFNLLLTQTIDNSGTVYLTNLTPGATYYVRVAPENNAQIGFYICIAAPIPPPNDECANALPLPVNTDKICYNLLSATNFGATQSRPDCDGNAVNDIWYQFTATDATYRFSNFGYFPDSDDPGMEIFSGACDQLVSIVCRKSPAQPDIFQQSGFIPGETYYLRLWSKPNSIQEWSLCIIALPPTPANDECAHATVLTVNPALPCDAPTLGTTLSASSTQLGCSGVAVQDVWYTFTAPNVSNLLDLNFTGIYFDANYAGFELLSGDCNTGASLLCQNNIYGHYQRVLPDLIPGQTYFLRLYNYNLQAQDFTICLTALPVPPNDDCAQATPVLANPDLHCNTVYAGTTAGASFDPAFTTPDVWYVLTPNSSTLLFQLLQMQQLYGAVDNIGYEIYHGSVCGDWQLAGTYDPAKQTRVSGLIPGETYFIRVFSSSVDAAFSFELCIQTPPPPPPNDDCAGALPLTPSAGLVCEGVTHGSTAGLVSYSGSGKSCYTSGAAHNVYDMWYTFTATTPNHIVQATNITPVTGSGAGFFELAALQSADCVNFTTLACAIADNKMYLRGLTPGETYYILVNSRNDVTHNFDLCVTTYPVPSNDLCVHAIPLTIAPTLNCVTPTSGTGMSASTSGTVVCGANGGDVWYTFTATQVAHTIMVNDVVSVIGGYTSYVDLELYEGSCGNLQTLICRPSVQNATQFTLGDLTPGAQYWIRLAGDVDFKICVSTPATPPANDACTGAIALTVSPDANCTTPVSGTTEHATASNPGAPYNSGVQDVWYTFTATQANHAVVFNTMGNPDYDYMLAEVYAGVCGALTQVKLQQYLLPDQRQLIVTNLTPGETYYVRVYSTNAVTNTFNICVLSLPQPPNDACADAISLTINADLTCQQSANISTYGATQSAPDCAGNADNDVWFQFTATTPFCRLEIDATTYGNSSDFGVEILEGTCAAPTVVLPCAMYNYAQIAVLHDLVVGKTYYLRLYVPPADFKNFNICLRSFPAPPPNDDCAQAIQIQPGSGVDCSTVYDGTTLGATQSGLSCYGENTDDVWYQFTATSTGHILQLLATDSPLGNSNYPGMEVYIGSDCANPTSLICFPYINGELKILDGLTVGETYFVRVFTYKNYPRGFSLCIGTLPTPPANVTCDDATLVIASPDMQCTNPVAGTTAGLIDVSYQGCYYYSTSLWYHFKATDYTHFIQLQNVTHQYGDPFMTLALYPGGCNGGQPLYCTTGQEIFATNLVPGGDYYIRVGASTQSGTRFDLCVLTPVQPANDNCAGVVLLPVSPTANCPGKVSGTTIGATGSYGLQCGTGPDVLYSFVATGTEHQINLSNIHPTNGGNPFLEVLAGDCGDWNESLGCYGPDNPIVRNLAPGKTYYVRLGNPYPNYASFDICITTPQPDLDIRAIQPYSDGCKPGNNESINVLFVNTGSGSIAANAAQFTLTVNGANSGTYGPIANTEDILTPYYPYIQIITFTGIDLSQPGESQISVTATLPNDLNMTNNAYTRSFSSLPLFTYYPDADADGFGNAAAPFENCTLPAGYVTDNTDCDDNANWIYPGATEICNGVDDDCNGLTDAADPGLSNAPLPAITCPDNITQLNDSGTCTAVVAYTVSATDNCGYTLTQTDGLASGAAFPVGATLNAFTVRAPDGSTASCAFTITVQKTADPDLLYAYTVIGLNDVFLKNNTVHSGGVGVTGAGKKARLQTGTQVTAANTFVKAPIVELTTGSQVATSLIGQVPVGLLPPFKPNSTPTFNNLTIANNAAPTTLALDSYGNLTVGINSTVTFSGKSSVKIRELTLKQGAKVFFDQNTELLVQGLLAVGTNADFNAGGTHTVQCFAGKNVTVNTGAKVRANIYTLQDLRLEKATLATAISMTGQFIANNVYAEDFAHWNWDENYCPAAAQKPDLADRSEVRSDASSTEPGALHIFPNPAAADANLVFDLQTAGPVTVQVLDAAGNALQTEQWSGVQGANQHWLRLGSLPGGVYIVQVSAGATQWAERLVVLRP